MFEPLRWNSRLSVIKRSFLFLPALSDMSCLAIEKKLKRLIFLVSKEQLSVDVCTHGIRTIPNTLILINICFERKMIKLPI